MKKIILQFTLNGEFVRAFPSIKIAEKENAIQLQGNLNKLSKRKVAHLNGYLWLVIKTNDKNELQSTNVNREVSKLLIWDAQKQIKDLILFHKLKNINIFTLSNDKLETLNNFIYDFSESN